MSAWRVSGRQTPDSNRPDPPCAIARTTRAAPAARTGLDFSDPAIARHVRALGASSKGIPGADTKCSRRGRHPKVVGEACPAQIEAVTVHFPIEEVVAPRANQQLVTRPGEGGIDFRKRSLLELGILLARARCIGIVERR